MKKILFALLIISSCKKEEIKPKEQPKNYCSCFVQAKVNYGDKYGLLLDCNKDKLKLVNVFVSDSVYNSPVLGTYISIGECESAIQ